MLIFHTVWKQKDAQHLSNVLHRSVIHDSQKKSLQDSLRLTPWFIPKSLMLSSCKIRLQEKEQFQASPGIEHLPPRYYLGATSN